MAQLVIVAALGGVGGGYNHLLYSPPYWPTSPKKETCLQCVKRKDKECVKGGLEMQTEGGVFREA